MRPANLYRVASLQGKLAARSLEGYRGALSLSSSLLMRTYVTNMQENNVSEKLVQPSHIVNKVSDLKLSISERAASRLNQIYKDSHEILKVGIESGGCHGFQYTLQLIPESKIDLKNGMMKDTKSAEPDEFADEARTKYTIYLIDNDTGKVVIDPNSLKLLNNTVLTYTNELIGSSFKISGGNMKSSCGCGSSFDVEI